MNRSPIIIGAGIAGLSSALALAHKGIASTVIEKQKKLDTIGAGIQLTPNATRILSRWGILKKLIKVATIPNFLELRDGISLKTHLCANLINLSEKNWKAPYLTIHRADLQKTLYDAVIQNPLVQCKMGEAVVSLSKTSTKNIHVKTNFLSKIQKHNLYSTPLLIGCDGVWSTLRQLAPFYEKANFSGFIAWRATTEFENLPKKFRSLFQNMKTITAWMGPKNHLIIYPIKSEKILNLVAITHGKNSEKKWDKRGKKEDLKSIFKNWNSQILQIFDHIDEWSYWPLFQMKHDRFLGFEQQVFVGDCAHAALPFAAQGAAMAIEDAATLAETLSIKNLSLNESLLLYKKIRTPRITSVKKRGYLNEIAYHAKGPTAAIRNVIMKLCTPESIMSSLDWLYMYDAMDLIMKKDIN
ncbi:FAD-binding protein [Bartonella sp. B41]